MKLKIDYEQVDEKYAFQATNLVLAAYNEEKQAIPFLPDGEEFFDWLNELLRNLFNNGTGIVAVCDNELVGFLCGFEVQQLFGKYQGIYCPMYGHGALKEYRKVYIKIYIPTPLICG